MGEVIFAHEHINSVHLCSIDQDGVHARDITEDVATTALHMCLTPRQAREGLEDAEACLGEPDGEPRASRGFSVNAGPDILQHLHNCLLLPRTGFNLDEEGLAAFLTLVTQNLDPAVSREGLIGGRQSLRCGNVGHVGISWIEGPHCGLQPGQAHAGTSMFLA